MERIGEACGFAVDCQGGMQGLQLRCVRDGGIAGSDGAARCVDCCGSSHAFKSAEAYAEGTKQCRCACVLVLHTCVPTRQAAKLAVAQQSRGRRAGAVQGGMRKIRVLCCKVPAVARCKSCVHVVCCRSSQLASRPSELLRCALFCIVCLSVVRWAPWQWPARSMARSCAILASRWPPPRRCMKSAARIFTGVCVGRGGFVYLAFSKNHRATP